jgi:hypothetical protein
VLSSRQNDNACHSSNNANHVNNASPRKRVLLHPKRLRSTTSCTGQRADEHENTAIGAIGGDQKSEGCHVHFESWLSDQGRSFREINDSINVFYPNDDQDQDRSTAGASSTSRPHHTAARHDHGETFAANHGVVARNGTPISVMDLGVNTHTNARGSLFSSSERGIRRFPEDLLMPDLDETTAGATDRRSKRDRNSSAHAFVTLTPRCSNGNATPCCYLTTRAEIKANSSSDDGAKNKNSAAGDGDTVTTVAVTTPSDTSDSDHDPRLIRLPLDILGHVASFLHPLEDRASTSRVCHAFHKVMQSSSVLRSVPLLGGLAPSCLMEHTMTTTLVSDVDDEGGFSEKVFADPSVTDMVHCFVREQDVLHPQRVLHRLQPFMESDNADALYMAGMIHVYGSSSTSLRRLNKTDNAESHEDTVECWSESDHRHVGIHLLRQAASPARHAPHLRAMHSLAIILRDANPLEANAYLARAHAAGFLPASMEVLTHSQLKRHADGDLTSSHVQLCLQLDALPLHRLLRTCFVDGSQHSDDRAPDPTSHCWNRHCGRWAYRAGVHFTHHEVSVRAQERMAERTAFTFTSSPLTVTNMMNNAVSAAPPASKRRCVAFATSSTTSASTTTTGKMTSLAPDTTGAVQCARMKMCSTCRRAKYCSKLCQIYDWRSGRHKVECRYLANTEEEEMSNV